jgi:hypothetical protein
MRDGHECCDDHVSGRFYTQEEEDRDREGGRENEREREF